MWVAIVEWHTGGVGMRLGWGGMLMFTGRRTNNGTQVGVGVGWGESSLTHKPTMAHRWGWGGVGLGWGEMLTFTNKPRMAHRWGWGWGGMLTFTDTQSNNGTQVGLGWGWGGVGVGLGWGWCDDVLWLLAQRLDAMHCYARRSSLALAHRHVLLALAWRWGWAGWMW